MNITTYVKVVPRLVSEATSRVKRFSEGRKGTSHEEAFCGRDDIDEEFIRLMKYCVQNMLATLDALAESVSCYESSKNLHNRYRGDHNAMLWIYYMLVWIKNTRAWMLLRGLMVILLFVLLAALFQMNTIIWLQRLLR